MSQKLVYQLLEELGGKATTRQIKALAKSKYPDISLHTYVYDRLIRLEKWGYIKSNKITNKKIEWEILQELDY